MSKISRIHTGTRVTELNGVLQQIINEYVKHDFAIDAYLSELFTKLTDANNKLSIAIKSDQIESECADLDGVVDDYYTKFYGLAEGYTNHPDKAISEPAFVLMRVLNKYGLEIKKKSFVEEYSLMDSLLKESETAECKASIAALSGCDVLLANLVTAVGNFNTAQNEYNNLKDSQKHTDSATDIKKQLLSIINTEVIVYLRAMSNANAALYGGISTFVAERITESNRRIKSRYNKE